MANYIPIAYPANVQIPTSPADVSLGAGSMLTKIKTWASTHKLMAVGVAGVMVLVLVMMLHKGRKGAHNRRMRHAYGL